MEKYCADTSLLKTNLPGIFPKKTSFTSSYWFSKRKDNLLTTNSNLCKLKEKRDEHDQELIYQISSNANKKFLKRDVSEEEVYQNLTRQILSL